MILLLYIEAVTNGRFSETGGQIWPVSKIERPNLTGAAKYGRFLSGVKNVTMWYFEIDFNSASFHKNLYSLRRSNLQEIHRYFLFW
jgi:hypothetical protein